MPKLSKGMKRRRNAFYLRRIKDGHEVWAPLGSDYAEACRRLRKLKRESLPATTGVASELADMSLESYVATGRNEKGQGVARQRVADYLTLFMGTKVASRVCRDDLRRYRLWLQERSISLQTVAHILADARGYFRWAEDSGYIDQAPIPSRLLPRFQERPPDRLTGERMGNIRAGTV